MKVSTRLFFALLLAAMPAARAAEEQSVVPSDAQISSDPVPATVPQAAIAAVAKLGEEVTKGNYQVAIDKMNPMWKDRMAKRMGGEEKLKTQLAEVPREMVRQGVTMLSFKPVGTPTVLQVWPGKRSVEEGGNKVEKLIYTKWLVLVPTTSRFRIFREGDAKALLIDSTSFQAAVCDKGSSEWTFIDGASLTSADLRSLFITLPKDLDLPPIEKKEVTP